MKDEDAKRPNREEKHEPASDIDTVAGGGKSDMLDPK